MKYAETWEYVQLPGWSITASRMKHVEKEINVSLQADQSMEYVNLNRILLEITALALQIVNGI